MKTIVQLSDLHFGRVDRALLAPLTAQVWSLKPDMVVISGDLTQRARTVEFLAAREFLDTLPKPQIVVPGNHDIALRNPFSRFIQPLRKYKRYITADLMPEYIDDEIAVFGINTARSLTIKDGRINEEQIAHLHARLCAIDDGITKVIVTHHPFDLPGAKDTRDLVKRAPLAMQAFSAGGADILLAGHMHASSAANTASRYRINDYAALVVQAGTATSTRERGETNAYNVLRIEKGRIGVECMGWHAEEGRFTPRSEVNFRRTANEWLPDSPLAAPVLPLPLQDSGQTAQTGQG